MLARASERGLLAAARTARGSLYSQPSDLEPTPPGNPREEKVLDFEVEPATFSAFRRAEADRTGARVRTRFLPGVAFQSRHGQPPTPDRRPPTAVQPSRARSQARVAVLGCQRGLTAENVGWRHTLAFVSLPTSQRASSPFPPSLSLPLPVGLRCPHSGCAPAGRVLRAARRPRAALYQSSCPGSLGGGSRAFLEDGVPELPPRDTARRVEKKTNATSCTFAAGNLPREPDPRR
nr:PREDICTED: uncharacterized protein LOC107076584 [Lepisosteus oculatus]